MTIPAEPRLVGLLLVCPRQLSDGKIPPAVLGSSMRPLAEAVRLCFASDFSSDEPARASLAAFDPLCKSCLSYTRPGFLTHHLASHRAFYLPFSSVVLSFLAQSMILPSSLNTCLSQTLFCLLWLWAELGLPVYLRLLPNPALGWPDCPRPACQGSILGKISGFTCGDIKKGCLPLKIILNLL